jgi:hypothetical protein
LKEFDSLVQSLDLNEHKKIFDYWRMIAPPGILPGRQHIDPLEIPADLLPWIALVDVISDSEKRRFRFRLVGTGNVSRYGRDPTGKWFEETYPGQILDRQTTAYDEVATSKQPQLSHNSLPVAGQEFLTYQRLLLPLASDGNTVDMIMALIVFDGDAFE